ncbi:MULTISPECIES: hypothetical protein [Mycetohabitans]|uniref:hypothetical protein n=1 Tax=Mycetohabitans TaxID=2571159 RepID=UPI001F255EAE|nr:hypothetical protein [Mycetohabitans sp. B5]
MNNRWFGSGFFAPDLADTELAPVAADVAAHASAVTNSVAQSTPMAVAIESDFICIHTSKNGRQPGARAVRAVGRTLFSSI